MNTKPTAATGTGCNSERFHFPAVKKRALCASFTGGEGTSDGGMALLRQTDRRLGLTKALAKGLPDPRDSERIGPPLLSLIRQRLYGLAQGYEDLNDHDTLRQALAWQTAVERAVPLASSPTLCRLENRADRSVAWAVHEVMVDQFMASFAAPPAERIRDFDATEDRVHGQQEGRFFHGYYGGYCFLPLYVFWGDQLLVSYLRPANIDAARHAWAVLKLVVVRLRAAWPKGKLIFRGDAGFCRWRRLRGGEAHQVGDLVGLAKNARGLALAQPFLEQAQSDFQSQQHKQRLFGEVESGAESWDKERRVLVKAEPTDPGSNPRFVVTNLEGDAPSLDAEGDCARGEMENRIKEQQLGWFADRTSCPGWWANQFRLLLSSCAYGLMERLRALALAGTELARAQVDPIRLKLLKIGAVGLRNTRRVRRLLSSSYPYQAIFGQLLKALGRG